jgi:hypothetical protein
LNFRSLFIPLLLLLAIIMFPIVAGLEGKTDEVLQPAAGESNSQNEHNDDTADSTPVDKADGSAQNDDSGPHDNNGQHDKQKDDGDHSESEPSKVEDNQEQDRYETFDFPKSLTVLDAGELEAVNVKSQASEDSETIGIVYGSLIHVDVLEHTDTGYSKISSYDYDSMKPITGYVPQKMIKTVSVDGKKGVLVKLAHQKVYVYEDGTLTKTFVCSTGLDEGGYNTPEGIYRIGSRGGSFFSPKYGQGAYNWVRFNKGYLFHSIPFDKNENIIAEEADKLGKKASHGCIRLSLDDARWFYNNIPQGTVVVIQD